MLKVSKEQKGSTLVIKISGTVDETDDFQTLIGPPPKELRIYSREITKINSVGVKSWIKYFSGLTNKGTKVIFEEFAVPFVEQMNMVQNFNCGGQVVSVCMPYQCAQCEHTFIECSPVIEVKGKKQIQPVKCPKCGGSGEFDDLEEEYLAFLNYT